MAYRFDTNDQIEFAIAPLSGYSAGPLTMAMFCKRRALAVLQIGPFITDSGFAAYRLKMGMDDGNLVHFERQGTTRQAVSVNDTTNWYLVAVTWAGAGTTPRFHAHNGTAWTHTNGGGTIASNYSIVGTDRLYFSSQYNGVNSDVVCVGVKKSDSADATVETLSRTAWSAWTGFGFDWLIGFDASLETAGVLQDQATPGTGDEIAITGTTTIADPAGWSWAGAAAPAFVPRIIVS